MSKAMQRPMGQMPAWLVFSGAAIGVVGASVKKHAESVGELGVALSGRTENSDAAGLSAWPMGLAVACCWRSRGGSWAGSDCPRRPTQTTAPRNESWTLLSCLWRRAVGSLLALKAEPAGQWRQSGMIVRAEAAGRLPGTTVLAEAIPRSEAVEAITFLYRCPDRVLCGSSSGLGPPEPAHQIVRPGL